MRSIITGSNNKNIERWCEYTLQASYTTNITLHRAINTTPYEAVFGITAHGENHQNTDEDIKCQGEAAELAFGENTLDNNQCGTVERAERQRIRERQSQYNEEIDSPVRTNMLLGTIMGIRKDYAKIVTPRGIMNGFISFSRLYSCTWRNVTLDHCKEISFTAACKQANNTCQ